MLWRSLVAGASGAAMGTGMYPFLPAIGLRVLGNNAASSKMWLRQNTQEWGISVAGTITRPLGFWGERMVSHEGVRPIVVIHGYAMNRACFGGLVLRMAKAGLGPVYGFEYWTLGKVSSASRRLATFINEICERHGVGEVDIVGHSMGGLVGRYYLTLGPGRGRDRVANLITLGTPHGGSVFSGFGVGRAKIELSPHTPLFQRMSAAPLPDKTALTVIWSRADVLVGSDQQARWHGAEEVVYDDLGHVSLLYSRRVAAQVIARLARPRQRA